jgi:hypothetical protein
MNARMLMLGLAACGLLVACEKEEELPSSGTGNAERTTSDPAPGSETVSDAMNEAAGDIREQAGEAAENVGAQAEELRAKAVTAAEDRLTQIESSLGAVETKLAAAAEPIKSAVTPLVTGAREQYATLETKVGELRTAGADQWRSLSAEISTSLDRLEQAIAEAASRLGG